MCKGLLNIVARRTGFTIGSILITGATRRTATLVTSGLCITQGDNIFKLSTSRIYDNVSAVKWVKSTVVRKKLPNAIIIKIIERVPIAVLQHDHISSLIDENGELIEATGGNQINLPVVLGEEANIKAPAIIMMISKFEALRGKVEVIKFVRKRRWDIVVSGLTVKLPEQDIEHAIEILAKIVLQNNINKDTASYIDLRVHGSVIVRDPKLHRKNGVSV
ncbi:MAG: cell division protein FtsQ/DivIB [Holosporales bacterium]|jgi:cell division protein FtsQ|nr:cell division protein FtsQ/DivIB [Holosporales bacterium]